LKRPIAFQLLQQIRSNELQQFIDYLQSPAFNQRPEMIRVLEYWRENRHRPPEQQVLFAKAFPNKPFLKRDYYLLLSRFAKVVEKFLVWQTLQQDKRGHYRYLLSALRQRQQDTLFERSLKQATAVQVSGEDHAPAALHFVYHLEKEYYDFIASHDRSSTTNLQQASDSLDAYYFAEKLKQACLAHSRQLINQEVYDIHMLNAICQEIEERPKLLQQPAVRVYYACYRAVVLGGTQHDFQQLRHCISTYKEGFPAQEIRDLYLLAINYCIRALNYGQTTFAQEALQLYEQSLLQGYLLEDGHLPESTFSNMVSLALKLERHDWVSSFIKVHTSKLKPAFQEALPRYAYAKLAYELGDLDQVLRLCATVEARQPFLYLGIKSLQLKALYEQQSWDALESLLDSMRVYLQRHADVGYHRQHYQLLIQFTRRLLYLPPNDKTKRQQLEKAIKEAELFREKAWILDQLHKRANKTQ